MTNSNKNRVLVFGASGQLGSRIMEILAREQIPAVAFLRKGSNYQPPESGQTIIHTGDLADADSVREACAGEVTHVIATASSIVPRPGDAFGAHDLLFYHNILDGCRAGGIKHLVYISAFPSPHDDQVPEFVIKREVEQLIIQSGIPYTIFRGAAFMDVYFAVMGSSLALEGVAHPTLLRGYWLTRLWSKMTSGILEKYGIALVPGNGKARQAFISIDDVARCMVRVLDLPATRNRVFELAGPEGRSWREVADIYAELLGRRVFKLPLPIWLLHLLEGLFRRASPAGANMMSILALLARYEYTPDMTPLCRELGVELTDIRTFIKRKKEC